jgi:hypothetical protein
MASVEPIVVLVEPTIETVAVIDPRIAKLEAFFQKYRCPYPQLASKYIEVADKYGLVYTLLPSISLKESTCGKNVFRRHNWWGYGFMEFNSVEEGMEYVADKLANGKYYKGKSLEQKLRTYNSVNQKYPSHAIELMRSIEN